MYFRFWKLDIPYGNNFGGNFGEHGVSLFKAVHRIRYRFEGFEVMNLQTNPESFGIPDVERS